MSQPITVLIQGWRGINHSYAMVNQYQLLELAKREELRLFHEDLPFHKKAWNNRDNDCGFDPDDKHTLDSLPRLEGRAPDVIYRITYPYRMYRQACTKLFVFGTSEYQNVKPEDLVIGPDESMANPAFTLITPSNWSRQGFLKLGMREEDIHVVPHGVEPRIFFPRQTEERREIRRRMKFSEEHFVFLNIGAMTWNKGIDTLILAYAEVRKRHPNAILALKDQKNLYDFSAADLVRNVLEKHPGRIGKETLSGIWLLSRNFPLRTLSELYCACDAYASPYRAEGFNIPPLEAAACGVPVILTSGGATDDYAHESFALKVDGKSAAIGADIYIEPDLDSLIDAMERLIEGRAARLDRSAAVEFVGRNYSWAAVTKRLGDLFMNVQTG